MGRPGFGTLGNSRLAARTDKHYMLAHSANNERDRTVPVCKSCCRASNCDQLTKLLRSVCVPGSGIRSAAVGRHDKLLLAFLHGEGRHLVAEG